MIEPIELPDDGFCEFVREMIARVGEMEKSFQLPAELLGVTGCERSYRVVNYDGPPLCSVCGRKKSLIENGRAWRCMRCQGRKIARGMARAKAAERRAEGNPDA